MAEFVVHKGILQSSQNYTWNVVDCLGRGATALVYLGRHMVEGNVVAVKVFHEYMRIQPGGVDLRELQLLRHLNHDNIIKLLDIEEENQTKRVVLVMEYCEGGSLYNMLDQAQYQYGLPEKEFLLVLFHVTAGMQYLRRSKIVHRDIKPANIMRFLSEDSRTVYKLTDFGTARYLSDDENFTSVYGTEEYLHPGIYERGVLGQQTGQQFDATVDLWSLGVTFYHVATGQLPFQPYGGRSNKETMFSIISQKESGVISGQQHVDGGPIKWNKELPQTCLLSTGVRQVITPILAGLMENDANRRLTYDLFFKSVKRLQQQFKLSIFYYAYTSLHTLFIDPTATLPDIQDVIASATNLPASQQLLLVGGHALEDVVDNKTPLTSYQCHLLQSTIFLFPREANLSEASKLPQPEIPDFDFSGSLNIDVDNDWRLAQKCLARGHLIKHHTEIITQQQNSLLKGHFFLRLYTESRLRIFGENLELIQRQMEESKKRLQLFYISVRSMQMLLASLGQPQDPYFKDLLKGDTLISVHTKAEERAEEIQRQRQDQQEKVDEARPQATQWTELCHTCSCTSKVEHHLSVITNIQTRFRRDRGVKNRMTGHDENIHRLESQKLQEQYLCMLSILTDHCVPARDTLHKQAFHFGGPLLNALACIVKMEENNKRVLNSQQKLSCYLDTLIDKYQKEMQQLLIQQQQQQQQHQQQQQQKQQQQQQQQQPQWRQQQQQQPQLQQQQQQQPRRRQQQQQTGSVDEGLGTSRSTANTITTSTISMATLTEEIQSLGQEIDSLLSLLSENMTVIQSVGEEPHQVGGSSGQPSRATQNRPTR